ncbi:mucin TcMUCII [Trypanosoma cruzi cruzi]|uniref:Putative mucin TcMUCII n=1 Tax=Trypanosoma cruzi TaxID=5693 RepID=A0A2V2VAZ0_TRYCR|nr:mucin TcMUCII [Trypanosoma cruzi cruzi]PWU92248.1 putative mucin TcMUCII [Trypanosoma cruzi]
MMTCRLLCALLVLALCCCPSVCVKTTGGLTKNMDLSSTQSQVQDQSDEEQVSETEIVAEPEGEADVDEGSGSEDSTLRKTQGSSDEVKTPGEDAGAGQRLTGTPGLQSDTNKSADLTDKEAEDPAKTTTTTTTAPETPSTTTTGTPTTTTSRAPSRLRKIDGSLSSSAWVCAPLLLAASALAYTALG